MAKEFFVDDPCHVRNRHLNLSNSGRSEWAKSIPYRPSMGRLVG